MLDGMTNIKASEVLKELKHYTEDLPHYSPDEVAETLEMAIKALEQQSSEDCISREDVDDYIAKLMSGYLYDEERTRLEEFSAYLWELPSVTPTNEDIKEAYLKGYDYGVKDWFKSKTQPTEAVSREAVEEITFQEPSYTDPYNILTEVREKVRALPSVTPERPKGKWIHWTDDYKDYCTCSECGYGEEGEVLLKDKTPYCPYCGSYNGGGEDEVIY